MKQIVILEKDEIDAIATLAKIDCMYKEDTYARCKHCPLYVQKGVFYRCLCHDARHVQQNYKAVLNSLYGKLVTDYADTDSTGEQKDAQSCD